MARAKGSAEVGAIMANAREKAVKQAVKKAEQWWKVEEAKQIETLKEKDIQ